MKPVNSQEPHPPRRGLSRVEAARYVGVSKLDQVIAGGRIASQVDARKLWDIWVDLSFESDRAALITANNFVSMVAKRHDGPA
jgi:hypothetical protein